METGNTDNGKEATGPTAEPSGDARQLRLGQGHVPVLNNGDVRERIRGGTTWKHPF